MTLFSTICNFKALHTTLSLSTEATTDCHNVIAVRSTDTLNKTATLHYGRSYSAKFASGNGPLKIIVLTSTCPPSLSKPLEVTFLTTKTLKTQKTQIIVDKTTVIHRRVKSGILDGLEGVMLRTCVHRMAASLFSPFHLTDTSFLLNMPSPCIISMLIMLYSPHCIYMVFSYINYIRKSGEIRYSNMSFMNPSQYYIT